MMGQAPGWWFAVPAVGGFAYGCAPPKSGLVSFLGALVPGLWRLLRDRSLAIGEVALPFAEAAGIGKFSAAQVVRQFPDARKILSVREPVARFRSLWQDKCRVELADDPVFGAVAGLDPDEFLDYVEAYPFGNAHWFPQYAYLVPSVELVPIDRFLPALGLLPLRVHRSEPRPEVAMPEARIRRHYDRDVALWEGVARE